MGALRMNQMKLAKITKELIQDRKGETMEARTSAETSRKYSKELQRDRKEVREGMRKEKMIKALLLREIRLNKLQSVKEREERRKESVAEKYAEEMSRQASHAAAVAMHSHKELQKLESRETALSLELKMIRLARQKIANKFRREKGKEAVRVAAAEKSSRKNSMVVQLERKSWAKKIMREKEKEMRAKEIAGDRAGEMKTLNSALLKLRTKVRKLRSQRTKMLQVLAAQKARRRELVRGVEKEAKLAAALAVTLHRESQELVSDKAKEAKHVDKLRRKALNLKRKYVLEEQEEAKRTMVAAKLRLKGARSIKAELNMERGREARLGERSAKERKEEEKRVAKVVRSLHREVVAFHNMKARESSEEARWRGEEFKLAKMLARMKHERLLKAGVAAAALHKLEDSFKRRVRLEAAKLKIEKTKKLKWSNIIEHIRADETKNAAAMMKAMERDRKSFKKQEGMFVHELRMLKRRESMEKHKLAVESRKDASELVKAAMALKREARVLRREKVKESQLHNMKGAQVGGLERKLAKERAMEREKVMKTATATLHGLDVTLQQLRTREAKEKEKVMIREALDAQNLKELRKKELAMRERARAALRQAARKLRLEKHVQAMKLRMAQEQATKTKHEIVKEKHQQEANVVGTYNKLQKERQIFAREKAKLLSEERNLKEIEGLRKSFDREKEKEMDISKRLARRKEHIATREKRFEDKKRAFTMKESRVLKRFKAQSALNERNIKRRAEITEKKNKEASKKISASLQRDRKVKTDHDKLVENISMYLPWGLLCVVLLSTCVVCIVCYWCPKEESPSDDKHVLPGNVGQPLVATDKVSAQSNPTPRGFGSFIDAAKNKLGDKLKPDGIEALKELAKNSNNMCPSSKSLRACIRKEMIPVTRENVMAAAREV